MRVLLLIWRLIKIKPWAFTWQWSSWKYNVALGYMTLRVKYMTKESLGKKAATNHEVSILKWYDDVNCIMIWYQCTGILVLLHAKDIGSFYICIIIIYSDEWGKILPQHLWKKEIMSNLKKYSDHVEWFCITANIKSTF